MKIIWVLMLILLSSPCFAVEMTEIMYAPTAEWGGQYNEWVELYSDETVNLEGWVLNTSTGKEIEGTITNFLIVAKKPEVFAATYDVSCPMVKGSFTLNNDGTTITLYNSEILEDEWTYGDELANKNNKTLERGGESVIDGGTPCYFYELESEPEVEVIPEKEIEQERTVSYGVTNVSPNRTEDPLKEELEKKVVIVQKPQGPTGFTLLVSDPIGFIKSFFKGMWIAFRNGVDGLF